MIKLFGAHLQPKRYYSMANVALNTKQIGFGFTLLHMWKEKEKISPFLTSEIIFRIHKQNRINKTLQRLRLYNRSGCVNGSKSSYGNLHQKMKLYQFWYGIKLANTTANNHNNNNNNVSDSYHTSESTPKARNLIKLNCLLSLNI